LALSRRNLAPRRSETLFKVIMSFQQSNQQLLGNFSTYPSIQRKLVDTSVYMAILTDE
jgi:hypothetical protein